MVPHINSFREARKSQLPPFQKKCSSNDIVLTSFKKCKSKPFGFARYLHGWNYYVYVTSGSSEVTEIRSDGGMIVVPGPSSVGTGLRFEGKESHQNSDVSKIWSGGGRCFFENRERRIKDSGVWVRWGGGGMLFSMIWRGE